MRKLLIALAVLFISIQSEAATVYERVLDKSFFNNDLKKAQSMIKKGAKITAVGNRIWYNHPSYKQVKFLIDNGYPLKSDSYCILNKILNEKNPVKDLFRKTKLLVDNGVDMTCENVNPEYHEKPLIFRIVSLSQYNMIKERKKAIYYVLSKMNKKQINSKFQVNEYNLNGSFDYVKYYEKALNVLATTNNQFNRKIFKLLINKGTTIDEPIYISPKKKGSYYPPNGKYYPINQAINMGSLELVKFCLNKKANPNVMYTYKNEEYNALDYAHLKNQDDIEMYLLDKGLKYHYYSKLNQ